MIEALDVLVGIHPSALFLLASFASYHLLYS